MIKRAAIDILFLISLFLIPWWLYLPFLLVAIFVWPFFGEALAFGFLLDVFYNSHIFTLITFLLLLLIPYLKTYLRFN